VANDGEDDSETATVTITVNPVHDPPVAEDDAYATDEDTALGVAAPGVLGNDSDADGDAITAVLDTGTSNGTLTLNPDGSFDYVPGPDFNGTDSFTYVANDGEVDSETATVTITVDPVNDPPVAEDNAYATDEDTALSVAAPGVLGNDSDADGDPLTAVLDTGTSNGTLTLNPDGSFDFVPDPDFNGTDGFTYVANDGEDDSEAATVTITVDPVNDPPVAEDDAYATDEDTALNVTPPGVLGNDSDADGDPLTAVLDTGTSSGTLTLNPDGSFDYVPGLDFDGTDGFTYVANDGEDDSEAAAVTITVDPVNDAPVASISAIADATLRLHVTVKVTPQTLNLGRMGNWVKVHIHDDSENNPQQLQVTLNGSDSFDVDGDALTYDWRLTGPHGDVAVEDDVVSQTVALSAGDYTVTLVVNDGTADSATASESFTLTNETIADLSEADPGEFTRMEYQAAR
jgi:VCBS repeat-containing protein